MKHLIKYLLLFSYLVFVVACTSKPVTSSSADDSRLTLKTHLTKLKPSDYHQSCQFLFSQDKKSVTEQNIWACLVETETKFIPQLVDQFLSYKPALQKKHLATVLEFLTYKEETIDNTPLFKKLIDAGAPTDGVSVNNMLNANVCDSVDLIIKHNLKKYKNAHKSLSNSRVLDLHQLMTFNHYKSCPKSIRLLAGYNPNLLDVQAYHGMTPLNHYLIGANHPEWNINIAKLLMTKNNLRFKDKGGYSPLHYIQLYAFDNKAIYNALIKQNDKLLKTKTDKHTLQKTVERLVAKRRPKCANLLNKTIQKQKEFFDCFANSFGFETETPYLVDKLLAYQPPATKQTLSKIIATLANDLSNSVHTKSLEKLIKAGASTVDVAAPMIIYDGNFYCDSLMLVLKNNSKLYDDPRFLNSTPAGENNKYFRRGQDLHALSAVGLETGICPEAIEFLATNHPHLRDIQTKDYKRTPLHVYLGDTHWPDWSLKTAKTLMSKKNINMQDSSGNTPLHDLNNGAGTNNISEHEIRTIKAMIVMGADVTIKNKRGKSVQDLFENKNLKLKKIFSESIKNAKK